MNNKDSLENQLRNSVDEKIDLKKSIIGLGVGFVIGFGGGIGLGEIVNEHELFKQAPYIVDVITGGICGVIGAQIGSGIAYYSDKYFKKS